MARGSTRKFRSGFGRREFFVLARDFGLGGAGRGLMRQTEQLTGTVQRIVDVAEHIFASHDFIKAAADESHQGLSMHSGQEKDCPSAAALGMKLRQRMESRCINRGDFAHANDEYLRRPLDAGQYVFEPICHTKK